MLEREVFLIVGLAVAGGCGGTAIHTDGGPGTGGPGATGAGGKMMMMKPGPGGAAGAGGAPTATTCTPGVQGSAIVNCGYPYASNNPLTSVEFNEDEVLRAIVPSGSAPNGVVSVFYNDEHALTLGVRQVVVKAAGGTTTTDYPVTPLAADPGSATSPTTGTNELVGPQSGLDPSLRPMWPVMYITDITADPNSRAGDWQQGGRPLNPNIIFGSWKAAVRTVDTTVTPNTVTITPDADPAKNNWNLAGGDTPPSGLANEGYGTEARWNVPIAGGRSYRIQVLVHDGDQNKAGGDSGEACVVFCAGGSGGYDGGTPPPPPGGSCPTGYAACGYSGTETLACNGGLVCVNGCCIPVVQ